MNQFPLLILLTLIIVKSAISQDSNPFENAITTQSIAESTPTPSLTTQQVQAAAETPLISSSPTSRPPTMMELSIEMAEANAKIKPTVANNLFLTTLLDTYLNQSCLRDRLQIQPAEKSIFCKEALEKVKLLDPTSPAIVCAEHGLGSEACSLAYAEQRSGIYEEEYQYKSLELDERFKAADESQFTILFQELSAGSPSARDAAAAKMLSIACKGVLVGAIVDNEGKAVTVIDSTQKAPEETQSSPAEAEMMNEILNKLSNATPTPEHQNISFKRIRLINSQCKQAIDTVTRELPNSAKGTCLLRGYFTPSCLEAEMSEIRSKAPTPTPEKNGTPGVKTSKKTGFETF